ncbi:MAG: hypothetical protein ABIT05_14565 [Chitinophagaceae bacterium]
MRGFFLFVATFLFPGIAFTQKADTSQYFEGYVDYKTEFKSLMQGVSDNEVRERIGNTIRIYYGRKGFKWIFSDDAGYVRSYLITDLAANINYTWSDDNPDTIFSFNLGSEKRITTDSISEEGIGIVAGCTCRIVKFRCLLNYEHPEFSVPGTYQYYFCPELQLDPEPYKNVREMKWNEIISTYKSVAIRIDSQFENALSAIFTAISIHRENIDSNVFFIDTSKFIKPTFVD